MVFMTVTSDQSDRAISSLPKGHAHENSAFNANESIYRQRMHMRTPPLMQTKQTNQFYCQSMRMRNPSFFANEVFRIIIKTSEI